jgi:GTP pyrophosphokinase
VRAWFNEQMRSETAARGREAVEKLLQREGKTALKLDDLAADMNFASAEALFEAVGKDELSVKTIEALWKPQAPAPDLDDYLLAKKKKAAPSKAARGKDGVLVVGVDSLLTQLAKCCKPAPPDAIAGFVTRGKGVSIHREDCSNFQEIARRLPDRVIEVTWGLTDGKLYPIDIGVTALDRTGLLRDISEVLTKEKCNVIGVQTQTVAGQKKQGDAVAWMSFTVELADSGRLGKVLAAVRGVQGVQTARRK